MTKSKIIERIEAEAGIDGLLDVLADRLTPTDLQSLLLKYRLRAEQLQPARIGGLREESICASVNGVAAGVEGMGTSLF
ncbi:MAG: hypothetical protein U0528_06300 [Anaerolineae bacterium]